MKRVLCAAAVVLLLGACGGSGDSAEPTPRPSGERGILDPIDRTQETVTDLEELQEREERQGESYYDE